MVSLQIMKRQTAQNSLDAYADVDFGTLCQQRTLQLFKQDF